MDEFKNNKDGKIEQLKVRQFSSPSGKLLNLLFIYFPG